MASNYPNGQNGGPGQFPTFNQLPGEMNGLSGFSYPEQGFPGTSNDLQQFQDLDADALNLAFDQLEAYFNPDSTIPTGVGAGNQNLEFFYPQAVASENHVASSEPFKGVIDQGQTGDLHGVGVNIPNGMDVDHTAQDITHHTQSIAHIDHDDEVAQEVPHTEVAGNLPQIEADGFVEEPLCRIKTFYVGGAWPMGSNSSAAQHRVGQMHVEQMDPEKITKAQAIILIHGDFHHGKVSKIILPEYCFHANNDFRSGTPSLMETQVGYRSSFGKVTKSLSSTCLRLEDPTSSLPLISNGLRWTRSPEPSMLRP